MTETQYFSRQQDALLSLTPADPSPSLTVLRQLTEKSEEFTLRHEPLACAPLPPHPPRVRSGRRAHKIATLTDLELYVEHQKVAETAIAFYSDESVACVLNEGSQEEKEIVICTLARSHTFRRWSAVLGKRMSLEAFLTTLRAHARSIGGAGANALIDIYSSLTGTLVHGAEEYLNMQSRCVKFTVKRKRRGQDEEREIEDVPTQFVIDSTILEDDVSPTRFDLLVRMSGGTGAQVEFELIIEDLAQIVSDHVRTRLSGFAAAAGFVCIRGEYNETAWSEPNLPRAVKELMDAQASLIAATHGHPV